MMRAPKVVLWLLIVAGLATGATVWWQQQGDEAPSHEIVEVGRGTIVDKATAMGQIEPRQEFQVKSKVSGIVERCAVEVGDTVAAGDPLFEISANPTPAELSGAREALESARVSHVHAKNEWERIQTLSAKGIVAPTEAEGAQRELDLAKVRLGAAREALQLTRRGRVSGRGKRMDSTIRAPAAGIVLDRMVDPGDSVVPLTTYQAGTELATIADMRDLIFRGKVDEIDVGKLTVGLSARIKLGAAPDKIMTGKLVRIAPQARVEDDGRRHFEVELSVEVDPDLVLRAGYSANADLVLREATDVVVIPERLVVFEDGRTYVHTPPATPEASPEKVEIEVGLSDGLNIEVKSGLEAGAQLIELPPKDVLG